MRDDPTFNIKFVTTLEKYPCLYNLEHADYNNRDSLNEAWVKLADELAVTDVEECKTRWKHIRGCLTRYLRARERYVKTGKKRIKKYYLYDYLKFVIPHTKKRTKQVNYEMRNLEPIIFDSPASVLDFEDELIVVDDPLAEEVQDSHTADDLKQKRLKEELETNPEEYVSAEYRENQEKRHSDEVQQRRQLRQRQNLQENERTSENEHSQEYWRLEVETPVSSGTSTTTMNSDMDFFRSILNDIAHFSPRKKRQFKQGVLRLIDDLCED